MKYLNDLSFAGKKAIMRVDFNVPLNENYLVTDDTRIKAALPSIQKILQDGGSVILMSHLGRPKEGYTEKFSLKHILGKLSELLGQPIKFADDCIGESAIQMSASLQAGEVLLLENLRFYKEEEKGDAEFAKKLAALGDIYVNDAFGTAHRAHASTAIIAEYVSEKVCGFLMQAEVENGKKVLENPAKPYTAIMGGAKISDKILLIENLLEKVDNLIIGGAMAYTFFKATGGFVGDSLVENDKLDLANQLLKKAKDKGVKIFLPKDSLVADEFNRNAKTKNCASGDIGTGWMGLDIGEAARVEFAEVIKNSKTVLWNGPMGVFEMPKFAQGTIAIAQATVEATKKGAFSLIGGGDSAAAINNLGFANDVSYVSTGGGALLEFMEGKTLPGVAALE